MGCRWIGLRKLLGVGRGCEGCEVVVIGADRGSGAEEWYEDGSPC